MTTCPICGLAEGDCPGYGYMRGEYAAGRNREYWTRVHEDLGRRKHGLPAAPHGGPSPLLLPPLRPLPPGVSLLSFVSRPCGGCPGK
jgi:hypothetical protein